MSLGFIFPGQGSQSVGMLAELATQHPVIIETFAQCSQVLNLDLWQLVSSGPEAELNRTELTQPALLAASVAVYRAWRAAGGAEPQFMAGHSLGEYSALVCAGSLTLADAVKLVHFRGQAMQEAVPQGTGAMAAVLNADADVVNECCIQAADNQIVQAANFNSPGQIVIAGHAEAVERAIALLASKGVKRAIRLPVSVPSHCELMRPAALQLASALDEIEVLSPVIPVLQNVDARPRQKPVEIRAALVLQLYSAVRWTDTVQVMATQGVTHAFECGPGKVLTGLLKRIDERLIGIALAEPAGFNSALEALR
jgi:[acyl-carrier-protein] S-malonyltransferase